MNPFSLKTNWLPLLKKNKVDKLFKSCNKLTISIYPYKKKTINTWLAERNPATSITGLYSFGSISGLFTPTLALAVPSPT